MHKLLRKITIFIFIVLAAASAAFIAIRSEMLTAVQGHIYNDINKIPVGLVAMVLGAEASYNQASPALANRLDIADRLYTAGKVHILLMSGDGRTDNYNEVTTMQTYAQSHGVAAANIILDPAGLRTYDSCYRAKNEYHLKAVTIISQADHVRRAVYVCRALGIDAIGIEAPAFGGVEQIRYYAREQLALIRAWLDLHIVHPSS